jgi:hypothetical protein
MYTQTHPSTDCLDVSYLLGVRRSASSGRLASSSPGRNGRNGVGGDRFIPNRSTTDLEMAHHLTTSGDSLLANNTDSNGAVGEDLNEQQRRQQTKDLLGVSDE